MQETQGIGQVGNTVQGQAVKAKNIVIEGEIVGLARDKRKELLDTIIPLLPIRIVFDNKWYIDGLPLITPVIQRKPYNAKFQFTIRAPYPYWRDLETTHSNVAGIEPRFKFAINYGNTYFENPKFHMFGQRTQTFFTNVINRGNVPIPFIVMFIAKTALKNPIITKVETNKFIRIRREMKAGEIIIVDLTQETLEVTLRAGGVESDAINDFDIDSDVSMELDTGDNLIHYDAEVNRYGLDCRIIHNDTWAGAYGNDAVYN